jgi:dynein heavy chain
MEKVAQKKVATDKLIDEMSVQQAEAQVQEEAAQIEAKKANEESERAMVIEIEAEKELSEAKPAMEAAAAAVDCLSKAMLSELKNLKKPPAGVDKVTNACLILIEKEYNPKKQSWNRAKTMMQNVDAFKAKLAEFRGEDISEQEIDLIKKYVQDPDFTPDKMASKSAAAANLCTWVVNIYSFNRIYVKVKPLMDSLQAARESKTAAIASLEAAQEKVAQVQSELAALNERYENALQEKKEVEDQAEALTTRADLAQRLVGGLASENVRWGEEIEKLKSNALTLVGDCMLAAGFVSYVGAFDKTLREELWKNQWSADLKDRGIPITIGSDPLEVLSNEGMNSKMVSEGLPSDRVSLENGSILTNCKRWPLLIDPQVQAIKWLKKKEEGNLDIIQLTQKNWLKILMNAITNGRCVIIENIGNDIDASLDPVLSRSIYKKGRGLYLNLGGEEVEYDPKFQLYLQTKLSNPHYKPEIAAQCTLINFIATERGLEDQLLAKVVELERPDLEEKARALTTAAINYQIQLVELEDELLERLANAPDDILSDVPLIEGLEATKSTAIEINEAVESGKKTQREVEEAREAYRPQAAEGAMLYFLLTKLCVIDHMYQYSLDSFLTAKEDLHERVMSLRDSLRMCIFTWVSRGLFERHKLIFLAQLTFNLMKRGTIGTDDWNETQFQFLIRAPMKASDPNPLMWLPPNAWASTAALAELEDFGKFTSDLVEAAPRFREWFNAIAPEDEKLPLDWAGLDRHPFQKMLVVRCLRPDRMASALTNFIRNTLPDGRSYIECDSTLNSLEILESCLADSTPTTPIYFILSPGANVVADLDKKATENGLHKGVSYHNVSMGQGQDVVAMACLETAHRNGHWVILNNVHLMPKWLVELEKKLDEYAAEGSHEKFRVFLTSDPSNTIPIGILNRCIKLTNEPPAGLKANLKRAWCFFPKDYIEEADSKTKSILFGLCHFHSVIMERKQFGPMGYNMKYPFSIGDLRDSATCLQNYMDNSTGGKIPWQDLKYIFGEIMYGGHIVNDFDRLVANEYLNFYMKDELLDETEMYPFADDEKGVSFMSPTPTSFDKYLDHIDKNMTGDTPIAFGLHPNAEIDFRTQQSNALFKTLIDLAPQEVSNEEGAASPEQVANAIANEILDKFGDKHFDVEELVRSLEDGPGPYQNVSKRYLLSVSFISVML